MDENFLLKIQIVDSCSLALPEGLKDLMCDISREVLRAQPENLLLFITKYLAALLVTRENIATSAHICDDVCEHICAANLEDELRYKGFDEEHIDKIKEIVESYLLKVGTGTPIKEGNLVSKILNETSMNVDRIEDIQEAVRRAVVRHLAFRTTTYELTPETSLDSLNRAVQHTLDLYHKTSPTEEEYERAAVKIGAAYKAYGVRRAMKHPTDDSRQRSDDLTGFKISDTYPDDISLSEDQSTIRGRHISFVSDDLELREAKSDVNSEGAESEKTDESFIVHPTSSFHRLIPPGAVITVSSTSLAGSLLNLPTHKPYTVFDELKEVDDEEVSTHTSVDYDAANEIETKNDQDLPRESIEQKCVDYVLTDYESDDVGSSVDEEENQICNNTTTYQYVDDHNSVTDVDDFSEDFDNKSYKSVN